jgi:cobaltochelatase CobN
MIRIMAPIEDRVSRAGDRTANWLKLRVLPNKEKRIGIILFNYPPGKDNL